MDFKEQYQAYDNKLKELKEQCTQAEKDLLVASTNLENLKKQRAELISEIESAAGNVVIGEVEELLKAKKEEFNNLMTDLFAINLSGEITQEGLDAIKAIRDKYLDTNQQQEE